MIGKERHKEGRKYCTDLCWGSKKFIGKKKKKQVDICKYIDHNGLAAFV